MLGREQQHKALCWGCVCEEELQGAAVLTVELLRGKMEEVT